MLQRGYSRDHRPDCKQVVIALIVNAEGFPLSYETFDGNRTDVTTLEAVMRMVERKYGRAVPGGHAALEAEGDGTRTSARRLDTSA